MTLKATINNNGYTLDSNDVKIFKQPLQSELQKNLGKSLVIAITTDQLDPTVLKTFKKQEQTATYIETITKAAYNRLKWISTLSRKELKKIIVQKTMHKTRLKKTKSIKTKGIKARKKELKKVTKIKWI